MLQYRGLGFTIDTHLITWRDKMDEQEVEDQMCDMEQYLEVWQAQEEANQASIDYHEEMGVNLPSWSR